jgi:ribosome biogenesis GTPase A
MSEVPGGRKAVASAAERKGAIREVLSAVADVAERAGLASTARDVRATRLPKLDEERFSLVVLGEFNHGKSTFINALLGQALLPVGITPTTAVLAQIKHGTVVRAEAVYESGARRPIDPARLSDWLTVEGAAARPAGGADEGAVLSHVEITHPSPLLEDEVTIVDTPGVNDINEQRAEITYGHVPRADAVIFLLDAGQILTASERQFLEERILRSSRDRLVFVVTKADLLEPADLEEAVAFARKHLARIVAEPAVFPISARRALAGDVAGGQLEPLLAYLRLSLGVERRRLLFDHALGDASRLAAFVRQSLGMRQRSLELPLSELAERVGRAQARLKEGRRALEQAADAIAADTAALKARVRQDLAAFVGEFCRVLPDEVAASAAPDVQRFLGPFLQDTWKTWLEMEGEMIAGELEQLAERVIHVANERSEGLTRAVAEDMAGGDTRLQLAVDTFKYDASVFALGALGTTVFLFVNTLAGGLLTLAAPVVAMVLKGRAAQEIKAEARERAPEAVRKVAATVAPKLDEIVDGFASRLREFIAEAGAALARGIAEVLDRSLSERQQVRDASAASSEGMAIDQALAELRSIDERIVDLRQAVWEA